MTVTERAPRMPNGEIISGGALNQAGHNLLESLVTKVQEHDDILLSDEGSNLGALAAKDTIDPSDLNPSSFATALIQRSEIASSADVQTCSTAIPNDNTIPQITEGDQILSGTFTPKSASSSLVVRVIVPASMSNSSGSTVYVGMALFKDGGADAVASSRMGAANNVPIAQDMVIEYPLTPGSTDQITFAVRVGPSASSCLVNGTIYGGTMRSNMVVYEYLGVS